MASELTLAELEKEQDEACLRFWEAMEAQDRAKTDYFLAEAGMRSAKAAYLRKKLEGHKYD